MARAIDCLVNVNFADQKQPEWMTRVKEDYFKGGESFMTSPELPQLIDDMDANGVERAILLARVDQDGDRGRRYAAERPDHVHTRRSKGGSDGVAQATAADDG